MTVYEDLAHRLRGAMRHHAEQVSPPTMRFKVASLAPLVAEQLHGDLVLTEGDEDFTITATVDAAVPAVGDMLLVEQTGPYDNPEWIATHVVNRGNDG